MAITARRVSEWVLDLVVNLWNMHGIGTSMPLVKVQGSCCRTLINISMDQVPLTLAHIKSVASSVSVLLTGAARLHPVCLEWARADAATAADQYTVLPPVCPKLFSVFFCSEWCSLLITSPDVVGGEMYLILISCQQKSSWQVLLHFSTD